MGLTLVPESELLNRAKQCRAQLEALVETMRGLNRDGIVINFNIGLDQNGLQVLSSFSALRKIEI